MSDILQSRTGETAKGTLHLGMFGLAVTFACYNAVAYGAREKGQRDGRLLFNAALYVGLAGYEAFNTHCHWSK